MAKLILENEAFKLVIGENAVAESLFCKATGEECLQPGEETALFSVTEDRPYNNEIKLAHPNKRMTFEANRISREGDLLIVGFELVPFEAVIEMKVAPRYMAFRLTGYRKAESGLRMDYPPVAAFRLLQLPVKNRKNFGEWLNVSWDEKTAVNVLAASAEVQVEAERRRGFRLMSAEATRELRLKNVSAALIADDTGRLMDDLAALEEDYGLPHGAESRGSSFINASAYWTGDICPTNVDEHIRYAKMGGFRMMLIYYTAMCKEEWGYGYNGDYDYNENYPNGKADVELVLNKLKAAGITPGMHFLQTHIGLLSRYCTPVADHRLHKTRPFTLAKPLGTGDTEIYVEQDPQGAVMADRCRVLQFGGELITYTGYSEERPFRFTGCERGAYKTNVTGHPMGEIGGILDVSEFGATSVYLDQESSLQDEIADKIASIFNLGFRFVYFDGSEGTNAPFGFHVPNAQYRVYKKLSPAPLYTEGAAKAHFGWHFLSGGNAFDIFSPEIFKEKIVEFPAEEAPRMRQDFTRLNFGWWGYWVPGEGSGIGTQADMFEFGTSRAAAWDCPITIQTSLDKFNRHPRTADILEVMRRWEDVRAKGWLTREQKDMLKDTRQEHILLVNGAGEYELVPYAAMQTAAKDLSAFGFTRGDVNYAVYWHNCGEGTVRLPLDAADIALVKEPDGEAVPVQSEAGAVILPAGDRMYIRTALPYEKLAAAFAAAQLQ